MNPIQITDDQHRTDLSKHIGSFYIRKDYLAPNLVFNTELCVLRNITYDGMCSFESINGNRDVCIEVLKILLDMGHVYRLDSNGFRVR